MNDAPYLYWLTEPPKELLNNESFPFRIHVEDPDVTGWFAEASKSFTLTFQTNGGEIVFPLGEPLWQEQVPAPPYQSTYLRLQGTLSEIQEAFSRISYEAPSWFVGVDDVSVSVSDGDPSGNLTGVLRWRVTVRQSRVVVHLEVPTAPLKATEDEAMSRSALMLQRVF